MIKIVHPVVKNVKKLEAFLDVEYASCKEYLADVRILAYINLLINTAANPHINELRAPNKYARQNEKF